MRKWILISCIAAIFASCSKNDSSEQGISWEYKILKVNGKKAEKLADKKTRTFDDQTPMLNKMGKDGWELVSVYTEDETVYPYIEDYSMSLRSNHRTCSVNFVFKRQTKDKLSSK